LHGQRLFVQFHIGVINIFVYIKAVLVSEFFLQLLYIQNCVFITNCIAFWLHRLYILGQNIFFNYIISALSSDYCFSTLYCLHKFIWKYHHFLCAELYTAKYLFQIYNQFCKEMQIWDFAVSWFLSSSCLSIRSTLYDEKCVWDLDFSALLSFFLIRQSYI